MNLALIITLALASTSGSLPSCVRGDPPFPRLYVGSSDTGLLFTDDHGSTWVHKTTADGLPSNSIASIFATGNTTYAITEKGLAVSNDCGNSWTTLKNSPMNGVAMAAGTNPPNLYLATNNAGLGISKDGGKTWTMKTTKDGLGSDRLTVVSALGPRVYVAGLPWQQTKSILSISEDEGQTWLSVDTPSSSDKLFFLLATETSITLGAFMGVFRSNDCGQTWTNLIDESVNLRGAYEAGTTIYAGESQNIRITHDDGKTWKKQPVSFSMSSITGYAKNIYVGSYEGLHLSADDGQTWTTYGPGTQSIRTVCVSPSLCK